MQYQPYKASNNATVQCSKCNRTVDIGLIAEHNCTTAPAPLIKTSGLPYPTGIPQIRTPPSPAGSFRNVPPPRGPPLHLGPQRPVLPKIDSSMGWQSSELTPASSGNGSLLASPVSATSSRTSRSRTRKPAIQRPPSLEMISQDCAFPPFPGMGAAKTKTSSKDRGNKSRKGQSRTKAPASTTSSARSSSQGSPLSHSRTVSSTSTSTTTTTRGRSRSIFGDGAHRPTTAPEGHAPEFSSQLRNITVPPPAVPSIPPPLVRAETSPSPPTARESSHQPLTRMPTFDGILGQQGRHGRADAAEMSAFGKAPPGSEPAYKSKRPPPIASNLALPSAAQSSKSPAPSSARSLKRTLTEKLFGRKPSNGRRSIVRAALSDEPEMMPTPPVPPLAIVSPMAPPPRPMRSPEPESPDSAKPTSESPILMSSPVITISKSSSPERPSAAAIHVPTEVEQARHASFAALEGTSPSPSTTDEGVFKAEDVKAAVSEDKSDPGFDFGLDHTPSHVAQSPGEQPRLGSEPDKLDAAEAMRRLSVDSASSYGSIGFTDRTFSSRSTPPPSDEAIRKTSRPSTRITTEEGSLAMPAPLRPRAADLIADSPTDPFCVDGRLSPLMQSNKDMAAAPLSMDAHVVEPTITPSEQRKLSSSSSVFSDSDGPDMIPDEGFRPRKDSLAGAPPPLFHRSNLPARTDSKPGAAQENSQLVPRPTHTPRQDSLASIASRSAVKGTCRGCSQTIFGNQKSVSSADGRLSGKYHKECFVCRTCREPFSTAEFYVHADQPYCGHHYHQLEDSLCATCGKGIEGLYMETANVAGRGKEKHHPACLKCATCRVQLTDDYFELSGKVYCERDAFRLAKHPRVHSRGPARPSPLVREYIRSGADPGVINGGFPERRTNRPMLEAI